MQGLLCITDLLITDYSSSMFDMAMLKRPCLLYATDVEKYDRGYYFRFDELPFPLARNQQELTRNLNNFDLKRYQSDIEKFNEKEIGFFEDGTASKAVAEWITRHTSL
jgi:CDP-glycerol glycerophosphotransferase